jgi:hypothetical protein
MEHIREVIPLHWGLLILISATLFTILWGLDALTHRKIVHDTLTNPELQTHRNILAASLLMEGSLVGMYWFPGIMLPLFIAFFVTRTAHEFIDELTYHTKRCTPYENYLHLGMWGCVLIKTFGLFFWGYFSQFQGIETLPTVLYIWAAITFGVMAFISWKEWSL